MITQIVKTDLVSNKLDTIIFRSQEEGREVQFVIVDDDGEPVDMTGLTMKFYMVKPDNNLIVQTLVNATLTETEQMTTAHGMGFYTIRISDQDLIIYTGQGRVLIDDHTYSDDQLESISEVDGLVFPDDFLTTDSNVAVINDLTINTYETWSSSKISGELAAITDDIIDDDTQAGNTTWSSNKIKDEILNDVADIIDDDAETTQTTWSSDKISDELAAISPETVYSTTPQKVGKWIDNKDVYEVVMEFTPAHSLPAGNWDDIYSNPIPSGAQIIDTKYIASGGAGTGWTSYTGETYQSDATNSYVTIYGTCGNGISIKYIIWRYIV